MEGAAGHALGAQAVALAGDQGEQRHGEAGGGDEHAAGVAHHGGLFFLGADHEARGVAEADHGHTESIAQLHEARRLVGAGGVDGAAEHFRVVGDQAQGPALHAHEGGDHAGGEVRAQLDHGIGVGEHVNQVAHVVGVQAVFRHRPAQPALVLAGPVGDRALEIAHQFLGQGGALFFVLDHAIDHTVGALHRDRAHFFRLERAQAAAFDHGRAGHADAGVLGGDHQVAAAGEHGVAGEAASGHHGDARHQAAEARVLQEAGAVQAGHLGGVVGVAGAAAAALGEEDHRQFLLLGDVQNAVGFLVVHGALGAGQDGVVVGEHRAVALVFAEQVTVHRADAGDQAVGGGVLNQVVQ